MEDPGQLPAVIDVQHGGALHGGWINYRFVLRTADGKILERSEEFTAKPRAIALKGKPEANRLQVFIGQLGAKGWMVVYEPVKRFGDPG